MPTPAFRHRFGDTHPQGLRSFQRCAMDTPTPQRNLVLVIGSGTTGSLLAALLRTRGQGVVIVDRFSKAFGALPRNFDGTLVEGDATEKAVLERAGIREARTVVVTTRENAVNMLIARMARQFYGVPAVHVRVSVPAWLALYDEPGIHPFCPAALVAGELSTRIAKGKETGGEG